MKSNKFLAINLAVYRLHVIVTWDTSAEEIAEYSEAHGCDVSKRFVSDFKEHAEDALLGLCMKLHNENPDVLVWLKQRPRRASDYGTLYHELYHAVDDISKSRNLDDEAESRAYIFEYLVTEANKFFWRR